MPRPLNKVAAEILTLWGPTPPDKRPTFQIFGIPYVRALLEVKSVHDMYGCDSADDIVLRLLSNVSMWRGPEAKRIKAELNDHLRMKYPSKLLEK